MATAATATTTRKKTLPANSVFALAQHSGAASSAFPAAASANSPAARATPAPAKAERAARQLLDPEKVQVRKGVPLPPAQHGTLRSVYAELYARMAVDDMVELTPWQATSFRAWARAKKHGMAVRTLDSGRVGCWRTA